MKIGHSVLFGILGLVVVMIIAVMLYPTFYNMEVTNCNSIIGSEYNVGTDETADCYKFNNFPVFNFTIPYFLGYFFLYILFVLMITIGILMKEGCIL